MTHDAGSYPDSHDRIFAPGRLWSLWDMIQFQASDFFEVLSALSKFKAAFLAIETLEKEINIPKVGEIKIEGEHLNKFQGHCEFLLRAAHHIDAKISIKSIIRLQNSLKMEVVTLGQAERVLNEIEMRIKDELSSKLLFIIEDVNAPYFAGSVEWFGNGVIKHFPDALFDIAEAGKCRALQRPTATVFHLMRVMEVGIKAVADSLGIPAPTKDSQRNWGNMLRQIKEEIDSRNGSSSWSSPGHRQFFAEIYGTLDAVRTAWRNSTMHVDKKHTEEEAADIFNAVAGFMKKLAEGHDGSGLTGITLPSGQ